MDIFELVNLIETELPPEMAMENDRLGLQLQSGRQDVRNVLVTLDVCDEVIEEASARDCDCIVTFHPLIFAPLTELHEGDRVGRLCMELIRRNIALVSVHTNFDAYGNGTSAIIGERLGLRYEGILVPDAKHPGCGMGIRARTPYPMSPEQLYERIQSVMMSPLRFCEGNKDRVETVAIIGGSGSSYLEAAIGSGADVFITADVKYHTFHSARGRITLIDPGHYEMEQFVPQGISELLRRLVPSHEEIGIFTSTVVTNPVRYYPDTERFLQAQSNFRQIYFQPV